MFRRVIRARARRPRSARRGRGPGTRSRRFLVLVTLLLVVVALAPTVSQAGPAPVLRANGETLKWTRTRGQNVFKLLTKAPGGRTVSTIVGTTITPPALPGATVGYRVKAAQNQSGWSNQVSIAYPGPEEEEEPPPEEEEEPPPEEEEEEPPLLEGAGKPKIRIDAMSAWDAYAGGSAFIKAHLSMIKAYPTFGDRYITTGLSVTAYHDPYTEGFAPLDKPKIERYLTKVRRDASVGYIGPYVDDANFAGGNFISKPGMANLIEAIRAAEPSATIEINAQYHDIWPLMKANDPDVARALSKVNIVTKEFGVQPQSGINTAKDYGELAQYVDALHAKGIHLVMAGGSSSEQNNSPTILEYNLATYLLLNDGGDFMSGYGHTPANWWPGFDVNLGEATSPRKRSPTGVWTRAFWGGVVYTVEPGAATQTIKLGERMKSAQWGTVESVTLAAGQGAVLVG